MYLWFEVKFNFNLSLITNLSLIDIDAPLACPSRLNTTWKRHSELNLVLSIRRQQEGSSEGAEREPFTMMSEEGDLCEG